MQSLGIIIFLILVKPLDKKSNNYLEIFNEICILMLLYGLPFFTLLITEYSVRDLMGWYMVAVVALNLFINMLIMIVLSVIQLI